MKIRNGFVSNSSSSSFVIAAERIDVSRLTPKDVGETTYVEGNGDMGEGHDIFVLASKSMLDFIKKHRVNFINAYICAEVLSENKPIDSSAVGKYVYAFDRNNYTSDTLKDLKENYGCEGEDNEN